jgi:DNA repair protein RecN (Recombination protein N)
MLRFLRIRDFALIRELEVDFGPGLNLLTGETGSGKSILVDALGLLLGERASPEMVRAQCEIAVVEGVFSLEGRADEIRKRLVEAGVEAEEESLIVRREINTTGRSRVFVNSSPAALALLKSTGELLADIHGQHDRQGLLALETHLSWLDRYGANGEQLRAVQESYRQLRGIATQLEAMKMDEQERLRRVDVLGFQINEIKRTNPQPNEREILEIERNVLSHSERIFALASEAYGLLYEREPALLSEANRLQKILQELESYDSKWSVHREALSDSLYRLEDLALAARDYSSKIDFSPERLNQVGQRLADLERLSQKYGSTVDEMLEYRTKCEAELDSLVSYEDTSRMLEEQLAAQSQSYLDLAGLLSRKRRTDAGRLERALRKEFQSLALEKMELEVRFGRHEPGARGGARLPAGSGPDGVDRVEFLVAPNKGEEMKPLARIASGGELSRVMLAIRSLCGSDEGSKILVFDEVDVGIGGRVAETVGKRLVNLARTHQVLCVTHLPQIAAFANRHYRVEKSAAGTRTLTTVRLLSDEERLEELARMLGGEIITDTVRRHAKEMRDHSLSAVG